MLIELFAKSKPNQCLVIQPSIWSALKSVWLNYQVIINLPTPARYMAMIFAVAEHFFVYCGILCDAVEVQDNLIK